MLLFPVMTGFFFFTLQAVLTFSTQRISAMSLGTFKIALSNNFVAVLFGINYLKIPQLKVCSFKVQHFCPRVPNVFCKQHIISDHLCHTPEAVSPFSLPVIFELYGFIATLFYFPFIPQF